MILVCNSAVDLDSATLKTKTALGASASTAVHGALSNFYKAMETLETSGAMASAEIVYLRATIAKLETGVRALHEIRDILATGKPTEAVTAWIKGVDHERIYETARKLGQIPASREQWDRLVQLMLSLNHLAVTDCLIADITNIQSRIESVVEGLWSLAIGTPLKRSQREEIKAIQSALIELSIFTRMVAYVNAIKVGDKTWSGQPDEPALVARA